MTALAEALTRFQSLRLTSVTRAYIADAISDEEAHALLVSFGCTDQVDLQLLFAALDAMKRLGTPPPTNGAPQSYLERVDIDPLVEPDIVADAHNLPLADESYDLVVLDPPYSDDEALELYGTTLKLRPKVYIAEAVRVLREGGWLAVYGDREPRRPPAAGAFAACLHGVPETQARDGALRDRDGREHGEPTMSGGVCEICGKPPKTRALHRDHDHRTGKPRGLLCFVCNRFILGKYATPAKLRAAADYLERYALAHPAVTRGDEQ